MLHGCACLSVQPNNTMVEATLPGISQYQQYKTSVPVKVTNVQLASPATFAGAGAYYDEAEPMQRGTHTDYIYTDMYTCVHAHFLMYT